MHQIIIENMKDKKLRNMIIGCSNATITMDDGTVLAIQVGKDGSLEFKLEYSQKFIFNYSTKKF
jgi:hypothetical protein